MQKILLVLFIMSFSSFLFYAEESVSTVSNTTSSETLSSCFESLLPSMIGKNVVVYLTNGDISFSGKLIKVYNDGVIIENYLKKNLFILKNSIAIIEIKALGGEKK